MVRPKSHLSEKEFSRRIAAHGAFHHGTIHQSNVRVLTLPENNIETALAFLQSDPDIEFAERDFIAQASRLPNDPYVVCGLEWHLSKIQAPQAWDLTIGLSNIIIAVLDSGVNGSHPDLAGHTLPGYDFVNNHPDASDDFGHGTAVAGTLVATGNNGQGVAGVSYGCTVLSVKVLDATGSGSHSTIAEGIGYAIEQGARIINLSLGGDWYSSTLQNAIDDAWSNNVIVIAAAGNTGGSLPQYPAACEHVLAVSSTELDDSLSLFSSFGSTVSLCAPGSHIWTTQLDLLNPYGIWSGTSFASPVVAGVAALMLSANPFLSNTQVVDVLKRTADDLGAPGYDSMFAYGRVNAYRAVEAVSPPAPIVHPVPTPSPIPVPPPAPSPIASTNPPSSTAPLRVQINGSGTIFPNLNGAQLTIGRSYRIRAVPALGQLFAGWNGGISSPVTTLNFTMKADLTLSANFVPNPFPAVHGLYSGLIVNTNGTTPDNSAFFSLSLTRAGSFTGYLLSAGKHYGFGGRFDAFGNAKTQVRRGMASDLALAMHVDLTNSTGYLDGSLRDATWVSTLSADLNVFNARFNPAQQAGVHPLIFDRPPEKVAFATGVNQISPSGLTRVHGELDDRRRFFVSSVLARNGDCPFYLSLRRGTEVVIGWLNFPSAQGSSTGTVLWTKTGTNAFASTFRATTSTD